MTNDIEKRKTTELTENDVNPFTEFSTIVGGRTIRGQLLKFSKGDWLCGPDEEQLPLGTKLVANMNELIHGWIRWKDNRPDRQHMGYIKDAYRPATRIMLGDVDENEWEVDSSGKPRDPWQLTYYMIMKPPGVDGREEENIMTFATNSRGGQSCVGSLCREYGKMMRTKLTEFPIVELGSDQYKHPNAEYGRIKVPTMKIVGWEDMETFATTTSS